MSDFQLTEAEPLEPDPRFARLRAEEPVRRVVVGATPAWLVTRYRDVRTVLTDRRFSLARANEPDAPRLGTPWLPPGLLLALDPPDHTRLRKLVAKAFNGPRIERLRPHTEEMVETLLDRLAEQGPPVDLVEHFAVALPIEIICELLGVPTADRKLFQEWTERLFSVTAYSQDEVRLALERISDYMTEMVAQRRRKPTDDLLSMLVDARDEQDRLSEYEVVMMGANLLTAGHETTKHQLAQSVLLLLRRHRDQWRALAEQPDRVQATVEELLRSVPLFGHGVTFPRIVAEPVQLGGVTLDEGELVLASITSANSDERVFKNPGRVDFERIENPHIAFGSGIHFCLGAQLARLELQVALRGLAARFPTLELAVAESDLEWPPGGFVRGPRSLPVRW